MNKKFWADIDGKNWDVRYPFCAGCEELIIGGHCAYKGNGCKYPEERKKRPITLWKAFYKLTQQTGKTLEEVCDELGNCLDT